MKKTCTLIFIPFFLFLMACGPNGAEKLRITKACVDSIKATNDSISTWKTKVIEMKAALVIANDEMNHGSEIRHRRIPMGEPTINRAGTIVYLEREIQLIQNSMERAKANIVAYKMMISKTNE